MLLPTLAIPGFAAIGRPAAPAMVGMGATTGATFALPEAVVAAKPGVQGSNPVPSGFALPSPVSPVPSAGDAMTVAGFAPPISSPQPPQPPVPTTPRQDGADTGNALPVCEVVFDGFKTLNPVKPLPVALPPTVQRLPDVPTPAVGEKGRPPVRPLVPIGTVPVMPDIASATTTGVAVADTAPAPVVDTPPETVVVSGAGAVVMPPQLVATEPVAPAVPVPVPVLVPMPVIVISAGERAPAVRVAATAPAEADESAAVPVLPAAPKIAADDPVDPADRTHKDAAAPEVAPMGAVAAVVVPAPVDAPAVAVPVVPVPLPPSAGDAPVAVDEAIARPRFAAPAMPPRRVEAAPIAAPIAPAVKAGRPESAPPAEAPVAIATPSLVPAALANGVPVPTPVSTPAPWPAPAGVVMDAAVMPVASPPVAPEGMAPVVAAPVIQPSKALEPSPPVVAAAVVARPGVITTPIAVPVAGPAGIPVAIDRPTESPLAWKARSLPLGWSTTPRTAAQVQAVSAPRSAHAEVVAAPVAPAPPVVAVVAPALMGVVSTVPAPDDPSIDGPETTALPLREPVRVPPVLPEVVPAIAAAMPSAVSAALVGTAVPAGLAFGAAKLRSDDPRDAAPAFLDGVPATLTGIVDRMPVTAPASADRPTLDMTQERWPQAMIAHIESLRDAADAMDTRIRLVPDALGAIDIGVRQDGDTLHVRFSAEQPQTRALLQDAQPRLAEAAEARGLRLGQSSVDAGPGGQPGQPGQQRQPQHPADPRAPVSARRHSIADAATPADDGRLA